MEACLQPCPGSRALRLAVYLGLLAGWLAGPVAVAGSVWIPGIEGSSNVPIQSIQERRFERVVRQQYDFSCGSAALATLLTYHYDDPTDEQVAFKYMYDRGDQAKIAQVGFSLLDMKEYLQGAGYEADGYKAPLETLAEAKVPAIALVSVKGYRHFVVVKGLEPDKVLIGDPALGLRKLPRSEFDSMWSNGILFIIRNKVDTGQRNFNVAAEWSLIPRAPLGIAVPLSDLAELTVALPNAFGEF
jgi:uncharacterized protein